MQNFIFAPEAREEQRYAAEGHHADGVSREGNRHESPKCAHARDVLLLVASMNQRTGAEEEQRLEKCVRNQVEHPDGWSAHANTSHHKAQLGNGGVSENALDVILSDCNERGEYCSDRSDPCHY